MDGYAVRAGDVPGRAADRRARSPRAARRRAASASGEAIEISTGGVVPDGRRHGRPDRADRRRGPTRSRSATPSSRETNIRPRGGDVRAGDDDPARRERCSRRRGSLPSPPAGSRAWRRAGARGSRSWSRAPSSARRASRSSAGQIYESNGIMLAAALREAGAVVERLGAAEDSEAALERRARAARSRPTSSSPPGASRSGRTTSCAASRHGSASRRSSGASRCGRASRSPSAFAARRSCSACPETPSRRSSGCLLFVRPALLALQGHPDPAPPFRPGTLASEVRPRPERDDFVRARVTWSDGGALLDPIVGQESHMIVHTTAADAIVHVPRGTDVLAAGRAGRLPAAVGACSRRYAASARGSCGSPPARCR